jgi:hypothetical protein
MGLYDSGQLSHGFKKRQNHDGGVLVKNLGRGIKAHFAGIERQDNRTSVIFVGKVLDYLEIATEHIDTNIIRNSICA